MYTRRTFQKFLLAGLAAGTSPLLAQSHAETTGGVRLGLEGYSLFPLQRTGIQERWIALMQELGLAECNLFEPLIQPEEIVAKQRAAREAKDKNAIDATNAELNRWRADLPLSYYSDLRKKFSAAGIRFAIYTASGLTATSTDAEMERACTIAKTLGADTVSVFVGKSTIKRLVPVVERANLKLGIMGHPNANPPDADAVARAEDYEEAVSYSPCCSIEIDIGDATGAGYDAMAFVKKNHARISRIELKDRKRDATSMPWGQGDSPVKDVLLYIRDNRLPIRCYIDCDYLPATEERVNSIRACRKYIRSTLGI